MTSALLPLDLRLRQLEYQIHGNLSSGSSSSNTSTTCITRRVQEIHDEIDRALGTSDALKALLAGLPPAPGGLWCSQSQPDRHRYRVCDGIRLAAGQHEIDHCPGISERYTRGRAGSARDSSTAESRGRGHRSARRDNTTQEQPSRGREKKSKTARATREIENGGASCVVAVQRLREFHGSPRRPSSPAHARQTSTVSDLFLELHQRMEQMEEHVAVLERKKRREMAERY
ncbi:hypothetical protein P7C73_g6655, partial [Tremellales sp. Uapishka_1]